MKKRVAIIGAGVSGLPAIKCCLDEDLEPVCFERNGDIGGIWNYEEALKTPNMISVMSSTVSNTSKEMSCYSDFPFPNEYPLFVTHKQMLTYLKLYAEHFDLVRHIQFNTEVLKVRQTQDFSQSGNWSVTWKNRNTGKEEQEIFNAVLLCSGAFSSPNVPTYEGQKEFTGRIITSQYKSFHGLENKTVVVVGIKSTGTDIASELGGLGSQVYLSSRRSTWLISRLSGGGVAADSALGNRIILSILEGLPTKMVAKMLKSNINQRFNHALFGMEPKHLPGLQSGSITINDTLPDRIISGRVIIKPNIRRFSKNSVIFEDDTVLENVDAVIFATGYRFQLPYLDCDSFKTEQGDIVDLYRTTFAPGVHPATIAMIGGPFLAGAIIPYAEMQCRVATRVFKGEVTLPSESVMLREIRLKKATIAHKKRQLDYIVPDEESGGILDFYLPIMTYLSAMCGCSPTFFSLLRMDIRLGWQYLFGPAVPAQFRLCGHGAWSGAKETVLSSSQRAMAAFPPTFQIKSAETNSRKSFKKATVLLLTPMICFILYSNRKTLWDTLSEHSVSFTKGMMQY